MMLESHDTEMDTGGWRIRDLHAVMLHLKGLRCYDETAG